MSLKLIFSANIDQSDIQLCEGYWAYEHDGRYVVCKNALQTIPYRLSYFVWHISRVSGLLR